tara:strand:- start:59 stop:418 length:360 start_codon:yes stop_codon:yes gene_type:complete
VLAGEADGQKGEAILHKFAQSEKKSTYRINTMTDKYLASATWCGFSRKGKEQLETNPIAGLKIIECDIEQDHAVCQGVNGFPTWKNCPKGETQNCASMSGFVPADKLNEFYATPPTLLQ